MTEKRKGARRRDDVPPEIRDSLNRGEIETAGFVEMLIIDHRRLLKSVLPQCGMEKHVDAVIQALDAVPDAGISKVIRIIGETLATNVPVTSSKRSRYQKLAQHVSDSVRSWACWIVATDAKLTTLHERLTATYALAADAHWGVRENVWIALRGPIEAELDEAIRLLTSWTADGDANVRRFASEVTRPRGVWAKHIDRLKREPEIGLPILEPLRSDESKYVRDSVANWLNDAGKSAPEWVTELCQRWEKESDTPQTQYVVKRALRNLRSQE